MKDMEKALNHYLILVKESLVDSMGVEAMLTQMKAFDSKLRTQSPEAIMTTRECMTTSILCRVPSTGKCVIFRRTK